MQITRKFFYDPIEEGGEFTSSKNIQIRQIKNWWQKTGNGAYEGLSTLAISCVIQHNLVPQPALLSYGGGESFCLWTSTMYKFKYSAYWYGHFSKIQKL